MIRKAIHIILAVVVLISTMGFTINMHYCHDQLVDLALYSPAESCCDVSRESPCDPQEGLTQKNHCEDESIIVEGLEDFVGTSLIVNFEINQSTDILHWLTLHDYTPAINNNIKSIVPEYYFPPPYQEVDLSQIQSYLI